MTTREPASSRHRLRPVLPTGDPVAVRGRSRYSIGVKLGLVMAAMIAVLLSVSGLVYSDLRTVARNYEELLSSNTESSGLQAQQIKVEFKLQVQEWKNILLRGFEPEDLKKYSGQFRDQITTVEQLSTQLAETNNDEAIANELGGFRLEYGALNRAYDAALVPFVAGGGLEPRVADRAVRGMDRPIDDRIDVIVARSKAVLDNRIATENANVEARVGVLLAAGLAALILVLLALAFVVARIVRPIRNLTRAAYRVANETLPETIGVIKGLPVDAAAPTLLPVEVPTHDELWDLAAALTTMQSRAVELALDQHRAERESADMLVNLGRRNQSLLKRTLGYISELESQERDGRVLDKLFQLDHATTRVRRNAESMLVLAGAAQIRTWSRPVPVTDVVRAALSEIEDYVRVDVHYMEEAAIAGTAVSDVVHLLAELMENATHFSPPSTRVTIVGQETIDGYRLRVIDQGVGMTEPELRQANSRIGRATEERVSSNVLGLYVVGCLRARRDISVVLEPSAGRGITATVVLPPGLLAVAEPVGVGSSTEALAAAPWSGTWSEASARRGAGAGAVVVGQVAVEPRPATLMPVGANAPVHRGIETRPTGLPLPAALAPTGFGPRGSLPSPATLFTPPPAQPVQEQPRGAETVRGTDIPRRVRGAQLPDLGPGADPGPAFAAPDPEQVRGRLSALINGVENGRACDIGAEPIVPPHQFPDQRSLDGREHPDGSGGTS